MRVVHEIPLTRRCAPCLARRSADALRVHRSRAHEAWSSPLAHANEGAAPAGGVRRSPGRCRIVYEVVLKDVEVEAAGLRGKEGGEEFPSPLFYKRHFEAC